MLFAFYHSSYSFGSYSMWYGPYGILIAVLGPIALRIVYECSMLGIILVKNVMEINKKIKSDVVEEKYDMPKFKEVVNKENFGFLKNKKNKSEEKVTEDATVEVEEEALVEEVETVEEVSSEK